MNFDWQEIIALLLAVIAAGYLARRAWRVFGRRLSFMLPMRRPVGGRAVADKATGAVGEEGRKKKEKVKSKK